MSAVVLDRPVALGADPPRTAEDLVAAVTDACGRGGRLAALAPRVQGETIEMLALVAFDHAGRLELERAEVEAGAAMPSISARLPQAQAMERAIAEQHGVVFVDHPWPKPLRRHQDLDPGAPPHPFFRVEGPGVHEVAVGPVHAGVIEPGHFRFQCQGEIVLSLEIQLGYQHRGALALLRSASPARRLVVAESIAGDTVVGHALAYCQAIEALAGVEVPLGAQVVRAVALELERVANHVGDLGALCNDVAFLPGAAFFGRLRGELLNLTTELSGNRFGRGLLVPGGVRFGMSAERRGAWRGRLARAARDLEDTAELMFETPTVVSRFEGTGTVARELADRLGLVGPAARAAGCDRDVRRDHPTGLYRWALVPIALAEEGDVLARALVRWLEVRRSLSFLADELGAMPAGALAVPVGPAAPDACGIGLVEGWRGEIVHVWTTGPDGAIASVEVVDPSLHNWFGLAMAMRDGEISDFPLCNKSFNLSYAGHDL